jgi:hypothetical protein
VPLRVAHRKGDEEEEDAGPLGSQQNSYLGKSGWLHGRVSIMVHRWLGMHNWALPCH